MRRTKHKNKAKEEHGKKKGRNRQTGGEFVGILGVESAVIHFGAPVVGVAGVGLGRVVRIDARSIGAEQERTVREAVKRKSRGEPEKTY
jgi:hypothetical protein